MVIVSVDIRDLLGALIVVATLGAILTRPRGISEALAASLGGAAMLTFGLVGWADVRAVAAETSDVLVFLFGMMIVSGIAERAGVFAVLAEWCARLAGNSGWRLLVNVFILGALITTFLSLDVTVIMLTPLVYLITKRRGLDPTPYLFVCAFVANIGSLALPVSNLTNLLIYEQRDVPFSAFAGRMWLPNLVAVLTTFVVFAWIFRDRVPHRFEVPTDRVCPPVDRWFAVVATLLGLTLVGLLAFGFAGRSLAVPAVAGAALMALVGFSYGRLAPKDVISDVSWSVFVFVIGMFLVVRGFEAAWLDQFALPTPDAPGGALVAMVAITALGSNIVNNVPMAVLALSVMPPATGTLNEALAYGTVIGANIGPALTTYGSLATMLWLTQLRRRGLSVTTRSYVHVALITTPIVLVTTTLATWLVLWLA